MLRVSGLSIAVRLAFRAHYAALLFFSIALLVFSSLLAAQFSGRQPETVALDVGISVIRLFLPLAIVILSQELISREFDRKYFLGSLSYPVSRCVFLIERFFAVLFLLLLLLMVMALVLYVVVTLAGNGYSQSTPVDKGWAYVVTILFLALDLVILVAVSFLLGVLASTPSFVLIGTLGFMLVARTYSSVLELLARDTHVVAHPEAYTSGLGFFGYLLPDLGALDVRMISLYGHMEFLPDDWLLLVFSSFGYLLGLLALSVWVLKRKRFD